MWRETEEATQRQEETKHKQKKVSKNDHALLHVGQQKLLKVTDTVGHATTAEATENNDEFEPEKNKKAAHQQQHLWHCGSFCAVDFVVWRVNVVVG